MWPKNNPGFPLVLLLAWPLVAYGQHETKAGPQALLPQSACLFAEISNWQKLSQFEAFRESLLTLADWPELPDLFFTPKGLLDRAAPISSPVFLGIDGRSESAVLFFRHPPANAFRTPGVAEARGLPTYYRDFQIRQEWGGFLCEREGWVVLASTFEYAQILIDSWLDDEAKSLAEKPSFQDAMASRADASLLWAFVELETLREAGIGRDLDDSQRRRPLGELFIGGIVETWRRAPYLTVRVSHGELEIACPYLADQLATSRQYFFVGETGSTLKSLALPAWFILDFSRAWDAYLQSIGQLFEEPVVDAFAEAERSLRAALATDDLEQFLAAFRSSAHLVLRDDPACVSETRNCLAAGLLLELDPHQELVHRHLPRAMDSLLTVINRQRDANRLPKLAAKRFSHNLLGWSVLPADAADACPCWSPTWTLSEDRAVFATQRQLAVELSQTSSSIESAPHQNLRLRVDGTRVSEVLVRYRPQVESSVERLLGMDRPRAGRLVDLLLAVSLPGGPLEFRIERSGEQLRIRWEQIRRADP